MAACTSKVAGEASEAASFLLEDCPMVLPSATRKARANAKDATKRATSIAFVVGCRMGQSSVMSFRPVEPHMWDNDEGLPRRETRTQSLFLLIVEQGLSSTTVVVKNILLP